VCVWGGGGWGVVWGVVGGGWGGWGGVVGVAGGGGLGGALRGAGGVRAGFASCCASPSGLPLIELAKPHCGLSARLSSGANLAASSIRRSSSSVVSTRA